MPFQFYAVYVKHLNICGINTLAMILNFMEIFHFKLQNP